MPRSLALMLTLATLSAAAHAQTADSGATSSSETTPQQAPIVRAAPAEGMMPGMTQGMVPNNGIISSSPIAGVWLRVQPDSSVKTISANEEGTEIRIEHGRANVDVHHPAPNTQLLVDLPGGQVSLLKDGLYTFNAETNTVRVLRGEAEAYPGLSGPVDKTKIKATKVKEDHELVFVAGASTAKSIEVNPIRLTADLLPGRVAGYDDYPGGYYGPGYGYGPYGDGFYPYPYVAYGWGYPWGWGYPYGYGLGFAYYGGFRGGFGGFRGGFRR